MSLFESDLADGRAWTRVGDLYEITRKPRNRNVSSYASVPFFPMEAIPQGGEFEARYAEKSPSSITSGTYFERGDILVAKITPSFENGKQALVEQLPLDFGYATTEVIPLHPKTSAQDKRLLFYYLLHPDVRSFVAEKMEGATGRQRVPEDVLLDLPFPEIGEREQKNIANSLQLVQEGIQLEKHCFEKVTTLKQVVMRELFTRGLRGGAQKETEIGPVPESWEIVPLGSLGKIGNGTTPNRQNPAYWESGTIPWITSSRMYERQITGSDEYVTRTALEKCNLPLLQPGAILIAIVGQGKTLGHCAILDVEASASRHVGFIQPGGASISSGFLRGYLESQYKYLRQLASGNGSTRGALTGAILKKVPVPLPSLDEQREIVPILDALDRKIALHRQKRAALEKLFRSLLHKLMTGDILVGELDLSVFPLVSEAAK